jgi:hypothetical protein
VAKKAFDFVVRAGQLSGHEPTLTDSTDWWVIKGE